MLFFVLSTILQAIIVAVIIYMIYKIVELFEKFLEHEWAKTKDEDDNLKLHNIFCPMCIFRMLKHQLQIYRKETFELILIVFTTSSCVVGIHLVYHEPSKAAIFMLIALIFNCLAMPVTYFGKVEKVLEHPKLLNTFAFSWFLLLVSQTVHYFKVIKNNLAAANVTNS